MRFLVIGGGSIGKRHARNLLALGHDVVVYNRGAERRAELHDLLGVEVYSDLYRALEAGRAVAAFVCTPNHVHAEHATAAARHGLHLFIEKPVAHDLSAVESLAREVQGRDLVVHIGANMRYHFGPSTVREHLTAGRIGKPLWAHFWGGMHLPDWHPHEDYRKMYSARRAMGGGVVLDFIHELDLVQWLFGRPSRVAAITRRSGCLDIETEDLADALLVYSEGPQVNVHLDYLQRPFQRGIRVVGDMGWVEWDLAREQVEHYDHGSRESTALPYPDGYEHNQMYLEQTEDFVACVSAGRRSESDLEAGRRALELALAIKESSSTQRFMELTG